MNMPTPPHPYVNEYVPWPDELTLFFSGDVCCSIPLWAWALMHKTDLYASDRGHELVKTEKTHVWAATVGLGKGLVFLNERGWKGSLKIKSHVVDCPIFGRGAPLELAKMAQRCRELLANIKWKTEVISGDENEFARGLVRQAYQEYGR
jgi:hypothetical protein